MFGSATITLGIGPHSSLLRNLADDIAMVENNVNMDKFQKRAVIKYLFLKGMSGKAILDDMLATLGDSSPVYSVVKIWLAAFKHGRNSVDGEHYLGCSKDAASTENVQIVNNMLKEDKRLTIRHIVETTDIHATIIGAYIELYRMIWA